GIVVGVAIGAGVGWLLGSEPSSRSSSVLLLVDVGSSVPTASAMNVLCSPGGSGGQASLSWSVTGSGSYSASLSSQTGAVLFTFPSSATSGSVSLSLSDSGTPVLGTSLPPYCAELVLGASSTNIHTITVTGTFSYTGTS
ncbi:MAG: hypothetical protein KGI98_14610, partial [Euryarchaeota archaeon]|nr:hypothetical protein [Euryarchaeota archaeon]MDE1881177.1 hypothetical protein [Euryarchaeota archaeon]